MGTKKVSRTSSVGRTSDPRSAEPSAGFNGAIDGARDVWERGDVLCLMLERAGFVRVLYRPTVSRKPREDTRAIA